MSSLINLATATLLAVSPVLSEPKLIDRPENVLYEKVEYLDNNIIATSYIWLTDTETNFIISFVDNKAIQAEFNYYLTTSNLLSYDFVLYGGSGDAKSSEADFSSVDLSDSLIEQVLNYNYVLTCNFNISEDSLEFSVPGLVVDNGLIVRNEAMVLDVENADYQEYYSNITNVINYNLKNNNLFDIFLKRYVLKVEGPGIIDNTFGIVGNTIQEYVSVVVDLFSQVVALFYAEGKLTILGVLMVFAFGIGVVKFGFNMMKTLLRL